MAVNFLQTCQDFFGSNDENITLPQQHAGTRVESLPSIGGLSLLTPHESDRFSPLWQWRSPLTVESYLTGSMPVGDIFAQLAFPGTELPAQQRVGTAANAAR